MASASIIIAALAAVFAGEAARPAAAEEFDDIPATYWTAERFTSGCIKGEYIELDVPKEDLPQACACYHAVLKKELLPEQYHLIYLVMEGTAMNLIGQATRHVIALEGGMLKYISDLQAATALVMKSPIPALP